MMGAILLQGPHQLAQKSTRTGKLDSKTSFLKLLSVKFSKAMLLMWDELKIDYKIGIIPYHKSNSFAIDLRLDLNP
jgi:hypothetical protein